MNTEQKLSKLASNLKPNESDWQQYKSAIRAVNAVFESNSSILKAETWVCGSVGKGTATKGSDLDIVILLSPRQNMENILTNFKEALKGSSTESPTILRRAVNVVIHGIKMDILPTKYGLQRDLGRPQKDYKELATFTQQSEIFKGSARILKHWRDFPENAPENGNIPSFGLEVILLHLMRQKTYDNYLGCLKSFFKYVTDSELLDTLNIYDNSGNLMTSYNFSFKKKDYLISRARHALKSLNSNPVNLKFLSINS